LVLLGAVIWIAEAAPSVVLAASARSVAEAIAAICALILTLRAVHEIKARGVGFGPLKCLREAAPFMVASFFTSLYAANFDVILIGIYWPQEHAGWYAAAFRLYLMLAVVSKLLIVFFYPRFAQSYGKSIGALEQEFHKFLRISSMLGLPAIPIVWVLAPEIVTWLYGTEYVLSIILLRILALGAVPLVLGASLPAILMASQYPMQALLCYGVGLGTSVVLNMISIPVWGELAAAIVSVLSEASVLLCGIVSVRHYLGLRLLIREKLGLQLFPAIFAGMGALIARSVLHAFDIWQPLVVIVCSAGLAIIAWGGTIAFLSRSAAMGGNKEFLRS
jgi:O-antigen/teichoic acid export membrane protein